MTINSFHCNSMQACTCWNQILSLKNIQFEFIETGEILKLLGWLLSRDVFRSYSASGAREVVWLLFMNWLDTFKWIFNLSERWEDVIRKNGQYIIDFCISFTINVWYEIRQDFVINLIAATVCLSWNWALAIESNFK